jgi:hypothetical protein
LPASYATYITSEVYDVMQKSVKFSKEDGTGDHMWTKLIWNEFNNSTIYGSTWWWTVP